jgi:hypothetical protein
VIRSVSAGDHRQLRVFSVQCEFSPDAARAETVRWKGAGEMPPHKCLITSEKPLRPAPQLPENLGVNK